MIEVTPGPLPIHFFTIVVKASAVDRSFPGGCESFMGAHHPGSYNGDLFCIPSMGPESVEWHLTRLTAAGIVLGADAALADMVNGPEIECPGLEFACEGEWLTARWTVDVATTEEQLRASTEPDLQPVQRIQYHIPSAPPQKPQGAATVSPGAWRRHVQPGGQVYWFGGDDEDD